MESAETPEQYDEARGFYEEAIAQDEHLKVVLADKLTKLEEIEKNQKASSYESQADTSLAKRRYKEACDLYKLANRNAVPGSQIALRIREKEDYMMKIISLEIANHLSEKGNQQQQLSVGICVCRSPRPCPLLLVGGIRERSVAC